MFEFHISREARTRYGVQDVLFAFDGNAVFANPAASRSLAHRMNEARDAEAHPELRVNPGALFAMGLIDEAAHALMAHYRDTIAPGVMEQALAWFGEQVGTRELDSLLLAFVERFPGTGVFNGEQTPGEFLGGSTDGMSHRAVIFEELLLLWFANANASFASFRELFDDAPLKSTTVYEQVGTQLPEFFATQPPVAEGVDLFTLLTSILRTADVQGEGQGSFSLSDQLARLRARWGFALGDLVDRMLLAGDVLKEEEVALWMQFHPPSAETIARRNRFDGWGSPSLEAPVATTAPVQYEKFSPDVEWMPRTVLIAKSTYVWLNQLSRFYSRAIRTLDQIPDEELAALRDRGMTGLWLIGLWERSRASETIKKLCGNADAVASAYSLYDYTIAEGLGGYPAYENLRDRAARYGIRLASDMVPNHMGIDSPWVLEHPEWFLQRPDSPYPAYSFNGPDLSGDDRVEIKIEDHYYEQTDAAVVFRRRDKWTGTTEYIYHGNDGTSFPWNDTAQLNYLSAQVREQVMQTILQVARMFPIIRFDAAMTLAKVHVQRLWFPAPGTGGAIPSRAESAMTTEQFDAALPNEFWREVVDRVAVEVPGTLLLAEAFWLMESYFVRTLGMHRVYNSAFMVLLRDEDNAKYRWLLKQALEFDTGILQRYVNFMSNPDERTAIDQFGSEDKYFGVATMMATLPGLPMFGHGQIEGFTEKYGMEYYKPRYEEWPNGWLVDRHLREIAPLLRNRDLFAGSEHFLLFDLWRDDGTVEENVYAYSNRHGDSRALIVYNNSPHGTAGTLHRSAAYMDKGAGQLRQRTLEDGLALGADGETFVAWREHVSGLSFLRRAADVAHHGIRLELRPYGRSVLLEWRELVSDATHNWAQLHDQLGGRGVEDLDAALLNLELAPLHDALRRALEPQLVRRLAALAPTLEDSRAPVRAPLGMLAATLAQDDAAQAFVSAGVAFLGEARSAYRTRMEPAPAVAGEEVAVVEEDKTPDAAEVEEDALAQNEAALLEARLRERLQALLRVPELEASFRELWPVEARGVLPSKSPSRNAGSIWAPALGWLLLEAFGESLDMVAPGSPALAVFDQFRLRNVLAEAFASLDFTGEDNWRATARVRLALRTPTRATLPAPPSDGLSGTAAAVASLPGFDAEAWADGDLRWLAGVHDSQGVTYFNKESYEQLLWWCALPELAVLAAQQQPAAEAVALLEDGLTAATAAARSVGYKLSETVPVPEDEPDAPEEEPGEVPAPELTLDELAPAEVVELAGDPEESATPEPPEPLVETELAVEPQRAVEKTPKSPRA